MGHVSVRRWRRDVHAPTRALRVLSAVLASFALVVPRGDRSGERRDPARRLPVGDGPLGRTFTPGGSRFYMSNYGSTLGRSSTRRRAGRGDDPRSASTRRIAHWEGASPPWPSNLRGGRIDAQPATLRIRCPGLTGRDTRVRRQRSFRGTMAGWFPRSAATALNDRAEKSRKGHLDRPGEQCSRLAIKLDRLADLWL